MRLFCLFNTNKSPASPKAGDDNRRVVEFLAEYVFEGSHPDFGPKCFVCRACFSTAAKSERALQSTHYELNSFRTKVGRPDIHPSLPCRELTATDSSSDSCQSPSPSPKRASTSLLPPVVKKARRSLYSTPPSAHQSSSPLVQVH